MPSTDLRKLVDFIQIFTELPRVTSKSFAKNIVEISERLRYQKEVSEGTFAHFSMFFQIVQRVKIYYFS